MIRHLAPRRIVEIGAGFSSAVLLDTNERFFDNAIDCTFVEPHPERLLELLRPGDLDRVRLIEEPLQDIPRDVPLTFGRRCAVCGLEPRVEGRE